MFKAFILLIGVVFIFSCKKTGITSDPNASVYTSADTLHFDTVFTTTGSITQYVKIFNNNDQSLILNNVQLMGGNASFFSLNVDGTPGTTFSNIEIAANDSLYMFVKVGIDATNQNLPFIVQDSIKYTYNGNTRYVQLDAYGKNAVFLRNKTITQDTTFTNNLPIVILGSLQVNQNVTLTINKGCSIYAHADGAIIVNGTLRSMGDSNSRVSFQGDRLDNPYNAYSGSWPGIYFKENSDSSVLNYTNILNAYQGVIVKNGSPHVKLTMNQCKIDNISADGILATNSSVNATNCIISNCGSNVTIGSGGNYNFNQCTIVGYENSYVSHKSPVLNISNNDGTISYNLAGNFNNCILYGEGGLTSDEIAINKTGANAFNLSFNNVFYKTMYNNLSAATFNNCIQYQSTTPAFVLTDNNNHLYDFHLQNNSVCKGIGNSNIPTMYNFDGLIRPTPYDLGAY